MAATPDSGCSLTWTPGSVRHCPLLALAALRTWGVNQQMELLSVSLSLKSTSNWNIYPGILSWHRMSQRDPVIQYPMLIFRKFATFTSKVIFIFWGNRHIPTILVGIRIMLISMEYSFGNVNQNCKHIYLCDLAISYLPSGETRVKNCTCPSFTATLQVKIIKINSSMNACQHETSIDVDRNKWSSLNINMERAPKYTEQKQQGKAV